MPVQRRTECDARYAACNLSVADDQMAFLGRVTAVVGIERESDQLRLGFLSPDDLQTALPDEIGFVHLYRPAHGSLDRRRQAIGVLPDDDVCLFQPQQSLRLDAE